jgi:hypothetical protein
MGGGMPGWNPYPGGGGIPGKHSRRKQQMADWQNADAVRHTLLPACSKASNGLSAGRGWMQDFQEYDGRMHDVWCSVARAPAPAVCGRRGDAAPICASKSDGDTGS